jgi:hypothetical protein
MWEWLNTDAMNGQPSQHNIFYSCSNCYYNYKFSNHLCTFWFRHVTLISTLINLRLWLIKAVPLTFICNVGNAMNFWTSWGHGRHDRNYRRSSLKVTNANIHGFVLFKKDSALNKCVLIRHDFFCGQNMCSELNFMVTVTNPSNKCKLSILQDMHVDIWWFLFLYSTWSFKIGTTFKIGWQGNSSCYCSKQQAKLQ